MPKGLRAFIDSERDGRGQRTKSVDTNDGTELAIVDQIWKELRDLDECVGDIEDIFDAGDSITDRVVKAARELANASYKKGYIDGYKSAKERAVKIVEEKR